MIMSLIRPEDFVHISAVLNPHWNQLLNTVDQFDQLMDLEKKQIATCVKQFSQKRVELVKQFGEFKDSLRFQGQVPKQDIYFAELSEYHSIFKSFHNIIIQIIEKVLVELLGNYHDTKRLRFEDFLQNVVFNIYPYYLPCSKQAPMLSYIRELLLKWTYSVQLARPTQYTLIDQAIGGLLKAPSIVCYVQKIVTFFLQQVSKCHMSAFAFDEDAITNEMMVKKNVHATFSHPLEQKPQGWRDKIKGIFRRERSSTHEFIKSKVDTSASQIENQFSFLSQETTEDEKATIVDIMKSRQTSFLELFQKTTEFILQHDPPIFLCRLMACFDDYLDRCGSRGESRLRHYCYFLMTNLILSQLHNKFTISHQDIGMTPADLQNISEVIKFLNGLFQGVIIGSDKYRIKTQQYFQHFRPKIEDFYSRVLMRGRSKQLDDGELRQNLLIHYEQSVVLSMSDIALVFAMLKTPSKLVPSLQIKHLDDFLHNKDIKQMFQIILSQRNFKHKNSLRSSEHFFLVYESKSPSAREIIDFYLTVDQPITDTPFIRSILLGDSDMDIQQTLDIDNDLKLIQQLPIRELRGYLGKLAHKHRELRVKDGRSLRLKFQQSFKSTLSRSLHRKEWLLYYKAELSRILGRESDLMSYFSRELNSAQFYMRMATSFCDSVRFKIYLNIEDNIFKVHNNPLELKKIQINTLLVAKDDSKSTSSNENYILRNSFKKFQTYREVVRCLSKNQITLLALNKGRKVDEFNLVFQQTADSIVGNVAQFISQKHILQVLSEDKLALIIVKQMQDSMIKRYRHQKLKNQFDAELLESSKKVNKGDFWERDLAQYGLDQQFIVCQGVSKFRAMADQPNVSMRLKHFSELFKIVFTILGFTMAKNKISAEVVNPLVQYIVLQCAQLKHYDCLFSMQALKWRQTPEDSYHLTLYQSALTYIRKLMPKDYPL